MINLHHLSTTVTHEVLQRAAQISLLVLDVDGVLTDGRLWFGAEGEQLKNFDIHDGLGLKLAQRTGIRTAIITGRRSAMVEKRATELGFDFLLQGREDKRSALQELLGTAGINAMQCAYAGDDLPDIGAILHAGLGIAVANAHPVVRQQAIWCTQRSGGQGAVREICDVMLWARGAFNAAIAPYLED